MVAYKQFNIFKFDELVKIEIGYFVHRNYNNIPMNKIFLFKIFIKLLIFSLHDQNKSGFLEGRLLSNQSEQSEVFKKLKKAGPLKRLKKAEKSRTSKKPFLF